ncbi:MAG: PKD domain-containing protein, partial [Flavobacteriales bacterium]
VNPKPVVNFGYVPNICVGNPTPFYDSSIISTGIITQWRWNFGDGGIDSVKNPAHTYTSSGVFSVNLQVTSDSGCIDIGSKLVYINPESNVNFTYTSVCVGDSVQFTDLTTIGAFDTIVGWYWDFGDGNTSTLQNPKHSYATNTQSYLVRLTVTSGLGCFNDTAILISHLPVPDFNYGPEFFGYCENETIQFYDSSLITSPTNIVGWEWDFGDGYKSFSQNPTHTIDSAGSYFVKLKFTTSDGCVFNDSILSPLVIYPVPIPVFDPVPAIVSVFRPEVYFNNLTTGAIGYVWEFGDGSPTETSSNPTHTFPNIVGYYRVKLTAYSDFGCVDSTFRTIYVKDEFSLYAPNAFTPKKEFNNVFLVKGYNVSNFHLKVFNRWGELIFETTDMTEGWDGTNNGKDCQNGVYIYQIEARDTQGNDHSKTGHVTLIK